MFSSLLLYYIVSLHQTTTYSRQKDLALCCIISFLYIKPQPSPHANNWCVVVLYRFSTSNHNITKILWHPLTLYYIVSLHQTTTAVLLGQNNNGCIISFLYIKPQQVTVLLGMLRVVLYRFSTSNHNVDYRSTSFAKVVLYRFSTSNHNQAAANAYALKVVLYRFSTSNHNWAICVFFKLRVVLYRFSTSNHNCQCCQVLQISLYYIVSLHQTTTPLRIYRFSTSNHNRKK